MSDTTTVRPAWTSTYKQNWDEAHSRMMAWWKGGSLDRPVVLTPVPRPGAGPFTWPAGLQGEDRDLNEALRLEYEQHVFRTNLYLAESVPAAWTTYGSLLCMLSAMAGAKTQYRREAVWIEKVPGDLYDAPLPEFREDCPPYAFAVRMIHRHAELFGWDCVLGADCLIDPVTTLSMMRGGEQTAMDLIDRPDDAKRWITRLGDLFLDIVMGWRKARAEHGRREGYNWTGAWAPGDVDSLQCDFSTMLSTAMFGEFVMPELERQSQFMDYAIWHLDGEDEFRHIDAICSVKGIRGIQWIDARGRSSVEFIDVWKKIRGLGRSLLFSRATTDEALQLTRELGKDGLAFQLTDVGTEAAMEAALKRLKAV